MSTQLEPAPLVLSNDQGTREAVELPEFFDDLPDLLSVQKLHELTGLSKQTIRLEINEGRLPGCRIGRSLFVAKPCLIKYVMEGGGLDIHLMQKK